MTGGKWSSSNKSIATVDAAGVVKGVTTGTAIVTYSVGAENATLTVTVNASPEKIAGPVSVCTGDTMILSSPTTGGTWSSTTASIAMVNPSTGAVTGVSTGRATIVYSLVNGCGISRVITVNPAPRGVILGPAFVCKGQTITLKDSAGAKGTWNSSNKSVATVDPARGTVTGVSAGSAVISYSVKGICGAGYAQHSVVVNSTAATGIIKGIRGLTMGETMELKDSIQGGIWSSSSPKVATVDPVSGIVTAVSPGSTVISYTVSGCGGQSAATATIHVAHNDCIAGEVRFDNVDFKGNVVVYLVHYDPATHVLEAKDSVVQYSLGSGIYYEFTNVPTDSFRIKAVVDDTITSRYGYITTYHTSHYFWHSADVIYHTSGSPDINKDVVMSYGRFIH